jgi:hypothetical protein
MEDKIIEAIQIEISRQAELGGLTSKQIDGDTIELHGRLDVVALAAAVAGSVAGGP